MRLATLTLGLLLAACSGTQPPAPPVSEEVEVDPRPAIDAVLDGFHAAAARADFEGYFGSMTADAVFIGTDATERWDRKAFESFARPHFEGEEAWSYTPIERHVDSKAGVAWFDERLTHATYGEVRGSGVLLRTEEGWKVRQYVLSFPIPNAVAGDVVKQIAAMPD